MPNKFDLAHGGVNYTVLGKWAGIFAPGTTDRVFGMLVFRYPESPFKTPISADDKRKLTASMFKDDKNWHVPYMVDQMLKADRSDEHTSELKSLLRNSSAVFCLKKNKTNKTNAKSIITHDNKTMTH